MSGAEDLARAALPRAGVAAEVDGVAGRAGGLVLDSRLGRVQVQTAHNKLALEAVHTGIIPERPFLKRPFPKRP